MGASSRKRCQAGSRGCENPAVGALTYYRRFGGPGQPWIQFDRDFLCRIHADRHQAHLAVKQGWPVRVGILKSHEVWQITTWWTFEDEAEACSTGA